MKYKISQALLIFTFLFLYRELFAQTTLSDLIIVENCEGVCWNGIETFQTTETELITIFDQRGYEFSRGAIGTQDDLSIYTIISGYAHQLVLDVSGAVAIYVDVNAQIVSRIEILLNAVDVNLVLESYGVPDQVFETGSFFEIIYIDEGIVFAVDGDNVLLATSYQIDTLQRVFFENEFSTSNSPKIKEPCWDNTQICNLSQLLSKAVSRHKYVTRHRR